MKNKQHISTKLQKSISNTIF